jgi:beta-phosphoglucomutase-like phosphatase (HAD superfamily)
MPLRAVVFDFDGVIANSEPLHLRAFQDVLAENGVTLTEADYYAHYLGFDDAGVFREIDRARGARWTPRDIHELVARKAVRLEALERDVSVVFPEAASALQRIAAAVPIAIASGARGEEIRRMLDRESLTPLFAAIVAAEDTPASKPAPDPYLRAVALLGAAQGAPLPPGDCVAIEDSGWGLQSARTAGLHTVAITTSYAASELGAADRVIASLDELTLDFLRDLAGNPGDISFER